MDEPVVAARFGVTSMVATLRRVAMRPPGPALFKADPKTWHYADTPDRGRVTEQYEAFVELVSGTGARIDWLDPADDGLADAIFMFDPSLMTGAGAVILRPGKRLRRAEVGIHRALYERLGVPILGEIEPPGVIEGGDCLWLDEETLAVGRGFRTNQEGIDQLRDLVSPRGVDLEVFDLPVWEGEAACLHLLSLLSPLDTDLALVHPRLLPVALHRALRDRGVRCLPAPEGEIEASRGLSLNVLATAPRRLIAVGGFPEAADLMADAGCEVATFPGHALCVALEGGPTCLTRPILRG